jgi:hypothetical protein
MPDTEPIFITLHQWRPRKYRDGAYKDHGGEYLTSYYAGQIPQDAVSNSIIPLNPFSCMCQIHEEGTGMPDEKNYKSHLMSIDTALGLLHHPEDKVLRYAWALWKRTIEIDAELKKKLEDESRSSGQEQTTAS